MFQFFTLRKMVAVMIYKQCCIIGFNSFHKYSLLQWTYEYSSFQIKLMKSLDMVNSSCTTGGCSNVLHNVKMPLTQCLNAPSKYNHWCFLTPTLYCPTPHMMFTGHVIYCLLTTWSIFCLPREGTISRISLASLEFMRFALRLYTGIIQRYRLCWLSSCCCIPFGGVYLLYSNCLMRIIFIGKYSEQCYMVIVSLLQSSGCLLLLVTEATASTTHCCHTFLPVCLKFLRG